MLNALPPSRASFKGIEIRRARGSSAGKLPTKSVPTWIRVMPSSASAANRVAAQRTAPRRRTSKRASRSSAASKRVDWSALRRCLGRQQGQHGRCKGERQHGRGHHAEGREATELLDRRERAERQRRETRAGGGSGHRDGERHGPGRHEGGRLALLGLQSSSQCVVVRRHHVDAVREPDHQDQGRHGRRDEVDGAGGLGDEGQGPDQRDPHRRKREHDAPQTSEAEAGHGHDRQHRDGDRPEQVRNHQVLQLGLDVGVAGDAERGIAALLGHDAADLPVHPRPAPRAWRRRGRPGCWWSGRRGSRGCRRRPGSTGRLGGRRRGPRGCSARPPRRGRSPASHRRCGCSWSWPGS